MYKCTIQLGDLEIDLQYRPGTSPQFAGPPDSWYPGDPPECEILECRILSRTLSWKETQEWFQEEFGGDEKALLRLLEDEADERYLEELEYKRFS